MSSGTLDRYVIIEATGGCGAAQVFVVRPQCLEDRQGIGRQRMVVHVR